MDRAKAALGIEKTETRHMYLGKDGHVLTFPVAGGKILNVAAFTTDDKDWPSPTKFTSPASKADAIKAFAGFNSTVRSIINLLPETLDKWAVFDTCDNPPPTYAQGRIFLAGDSAHAAAPYHGAGAGFAIEDGVVVAHLLSLATRENMPAALQVCSNVRLERAQWLVEGSRFVGRMYQWQDEMVGEDLQKCAEEIEWRSRRIWDYDIDEMVVQAEKAFGGLKSAYTV
jgi:salicylate hydroxylase